MYVFFLTITIKTHMRRAVLPSISSWLTPLSHQIIKPNLLWFTQTSPKRIFFSKRNSKISKRSIATNLIWYTSLTNPAKAGKVSAYQKSHKSFYWCLSIGGTGYITTDVIKKYVAAPDLKEKIKVFVCGPPPQVTSLAGKKDGPQQGEFGGILKELGYTVDQVCFRFCSFRHSSMLSRSTNAESLLWHH